MALSVFRRASRTPVRWHLRQQQQMQGLVVPANRFTAPSMASAAESRSPLRNMALRLASTARDAGRDADGSLVSILRSEMDHERKAFSQPKEITRGPPKPWSLTDKPGHADVILRRSFGQEDIAVTCVYQPDAYDERPEDDYDEDEGEQAGGGSCISMTITINKGADNPTLEISAASYGTQITIDHVYFWEDKDTKISTYDGPNFLQLDEEVQTQFENYIKSRGINRDLTGYLFTLLADKEQREYMNWLQKVEKFLRQ